MELALTGVIAVAVIVAVARFSPRLGVAAPLILVVVGLGASLVPAVPEVEVEPEWILVGVLPPLLYSSAVNVPLMDFRRNLKAISSLSVLLVIVTTAIAGGVLYLVFPDLDLAAALALGAVVSPPDAVAATSIGKRLGLPPRLVTLLEGEGLVNDASALVLLRSAIAATAGAVTFWGVVGDFVLAVVLALVVGLLVGYVTVEVRARLDSPMLTTAVSFAVPFAAYVPAEELGASGVLSVVVAGLVTGHRGATRLSAQDRITERLNWRTLQFLLEHGVFLLMGLELSALVREVQEDRLGVGTAVLIGLLTTAVLVVVRFAFVGPLVLSLRRDARRAAAAGERLDGFLDALDSGDRERVSPRRRELARRMVTRRRADIDFLVSEGLGWRGGAVLAWAGMRGVVTLAAAQTLPHSLPYRPQLVLVAFTVAIVTLLVQGGTLPAVIRLVKPRTSAPEQERADLANLLEEITTAGLAAVSDDALDGDQVDPGTLRRVRDEASLHVADVHGFTADGEPSTYLRLRRRVLEAQRAALLDARSVGAYPSRALTRAARLLDDEEARLYTRGDEH